MGYPSETHLKLKSRKVSFAHILFLSHQIIFKFCTEHDRDTAVLCVQNFKTIEWLNQFFMDDRDFTITLLSLQVIEVIVIDADDESLEMDE